jgi:flavin reductase (DIM6/NTAB) family NADH-FMN oxidoreductase RutF
MDTNADEIAPTSSHVRIEPSILYFGTPVVLLSTLNDDGTPNLAPMSSAWALGYTVVLGLGRSGQTVANLARLGECVINLPSAELWSNVERLAPLTGRYPVPEAKSEQFSYEPQKFEAAGLTAQASQMVAPPRVAECPLQLEAEVVSITPIGAEATAASVETRVVAVHATPEIVIEETQRIDPEHWRPLLYVFRHYFGTGDELGRSFRAER